MGARYAAVIAFILCATAFPASAGALYQMVGGSCTYSNVGGCGSGTVYADVFMVDGYVPGTSFASPSQGPDPSAVAIFLFSDGDPVVGTEARYDFPLDFYGVGNFGQMPNGVGQGSLHIHWFDTSFSFDADGGVWTFCRVFCEGYFSTGTYLEWAGPRVVAEPQSLALLGVAVATTVLVLSIRSRMRMRA